MSAAWQRTFPMRSGGEHVLGIFAVAACSGQMMRPGSTGTATGDPATTGTGTGTTTGAAGGTQVVSGAAGSGMQSTGAAGETIVTTGSAGSGPPPNLDNCTGALPGSYNTLCSGCHNQAGTANSRYPDLYKFMGTEAVFLMQVRMGGMQMAAYPTTLITDDDVMKIFTYFTGQAGQRPSLDSISLGGVVPLFATADAKNSEIFTRDDGAMLYAALAAFVVATRRKAASVSSSSTSTTGPTASVSGASTRTTAKHIDKPGPSPCRITTIAHRELAALEDAGRQRDLRWGTATC